MTDALQRTAERVQDSMDEILANFKTGAKITVLVRTPENPNADFCMTSDELDEVIAMVRRRKGENPSPSTHVKGLTISSAEVKALLYGVPKHEFSTALSRLASWLGEHDDETPTPSGNNITGLKPISIEAAKRIAKEYGYDQVLIYARRCHDTPEPHGEHMTTYGRNREHCDVAARIGDTLKNFMGWEV